MAVKLEISNNYFKITNGSSNPARFPYRDVRFQALDSTELLNFFLGDSLKPIYPEPFDFADEPAEGSVTIDTTTATKATGTVTLASAVANTFSTGTAQCTSCIAGDELVVNGLTYTGVAGVKTDNTEFSIDTSDDATATDLADSINNDIRVGTLGTVSATASTDTVTLTTDVEGVAGDATTLAQTGGTITLSGAVFSGGVDANIATINGLTYTAVAGARADDTQFSIDTSDTAAATDLAAAITADTRTGLVLDLTATSALGVVTLVPSLGGVIGNTIALSENTGATTITVSGATMSGGLDDAEVSGILVNSVQVMSGAETSIDDVSTLATQVAANITAFTSTPNYTATSLAGVITITAADDDTNVNGFVVASTVVKATSTDANMAGATANIVDSAGDPFDTWADLITFLEKNTGGELIA